MRYGYRRLHILLKREGWRINAKRVYRLYCKENLGLRTRTPKRPVSCRTRVGRPEQINDCWAMDFMADELFDGRRIRVLTIADRFSREGLGLEVGQGELKTYLAEQRRVNSEPDRRLRPGDKRSCGV